VNQPNSVSLNHLGTLYREAVTRVIVRVGDLSIGDPN